MSDRAEYPLSSSQERMYFLEQLGVAGALFNIPFMWRIEGPLHPAHLERCIEQLLRRHDTLRTRFDIGDDGPVQIIQPSVPFRFGDHLLEASDADGRCEAQALLDEQGAVPLGLEDGPPLRIRLLRVNSELHYFALTMHHMICDGWSREILIRELGAMYSARIRGEEPELAPLVCRYVDAVLEERRQSPHLRGLIDHWTKVLEGAPRSLDLPTDHPRPPVQDFRGAHLSFEVTGELLGALRDMARVERTTLYVILFAAFAVLLGQVCGKSDLVIGSTVAGRAQPQWHPIVGCFINTLPVRLQVSRQERVADFIARARRVMIDAWAHQAVPVDRVIAALRLAPDLSQTPLYQAAMSLQNYPRHGLLLEGCTTQEMVPPHIATPVDLSLHVRQSSDSLQASLHYSTALLDARTVAGYAAAYENVLRQLVTGGAARVHDLL